MLSGERAAAVADFEAALRGWGGKAHPSSLRAVQLWLGIVGETPRLEALASNGGGFYGALALAVLGRLSPDAATERAASAYGKDPRWQRLGRAAALAYLGAWAWVKGDEAAAEERFAACLAICETRPEGPLMSGATFWYMRDVARAWRALHPR